MSARAKINAQGRLVIPAECRKAAGIGPGDEVSIEVVGKGELRLFTRARAVRRAQELYARHGSKDRDLVGELIAERRKEAARERG